MTIHDFTLFHKFYHVIEGNRFRHNHNKKLGPPPRFFYLFFVGIGVGGLFRRFVLLGRFFWCVRCFFFFGLFWRHRLWRFLFFRIRHRFFFQFKWVCVVVAFLGFSTYLNRFIFLDWFFVAFLGFVCLDLFRLASLCVVFLFSCLIWVCVTQDSPPISSMNLLICAFLSSVTLFRSSFSSWVIVFLTGLLISNSAIILLTSSASFS